MEVKQLHTKQLYSFIFMKNSKKEQKMLIKGRGMGRDYNPSTPPLEPPLSDSHTLHVALLY